MLGAQFRPFPLTQISCSDNVKRVSSPSLSSSTLTVVQRRGVLEGIIREHADIRVSCNQDQRDCKTIHPTTEWSLIK